MIRRPLQAVVDASVAVKLFVPEPLSAEAQAVFSRFAKEPDAELIVPDLFFIECANVFWKWVKRHSYSAATAREHLHELKKLGLTALPLEHLAEEALIIADRHSITAYDACYVAASDLFGVPLITADQKLVAALPKQAFDIHWLGEPDILNSA